MSITIGCDPEVFLRDTRTLEFVCADGLVPGTKTAPHPVPKGMIQVDGFAAEFGIIPTSNKDTFVRRVAQVLKTLRAEAQKRNPNVDIDIVTTATFTKKVMDAAPDHAKVLGCDPDYNAYTGLANPAPNATNLDFRTGGGHIHIGWTSGQNTNCPDHFEACRLLTKEMDVLLGVPSLVWDSDSKRRTLYGNLGAFRPKSYGMEYRTLSNAWLKHPLLVEHVFCATKEAVTRLIDGRPTFNSNTITRAREIYETNNRTSAYWFNQSNLPTIPVPKPPKELKRSF
jgi:Phage phiEco32-like COOH.NH2 ligase-type 2